MSFGSIVLSIGPFIPQERRKSGHSSTSQKCQFRTHAAQQIASLFNHLIGAYEQGRWHSEAEHLRSLEIDGQLEAGRLFDWKVAGPGAFENLVDVSGHAPR